VQFTSSSRVKVLVSLVAASPLLVLEGFSLVVSCASSASIGNGADHDVPLGGISFYAQRLGFAADNVIRWEIVLASGVVMNCTANENSDIYRALKGGGNNFGIVTQVDVHTVPQGPIWGGMITTLQSGNLASNFKSLFNYVENSGNGEDSGSS
jgi:hypothetical protein